MAKLRNSELFSPERPGMITILNKQRMIFEGVERIIFCDSEKMIIKNRYLTKVLGSGLHLLELGNRNIAIVGQIHSIHFERSGK